MESSWSLIEKGQFEEAYKRATEEFEESGSLFHLNNRAISSLLVKNYHSALEDYLRVLNDTSPFNRGDDNYIKIGLTYWLLDEYTKATEMWIDAVSLKLRFTSNIVSAPCILYFSGIYQNDLKLIKAAEKYLKKHVKNKIPLAEFLMGYITENDLLNSIDHNTSLYERMKCKTEFYIAAKYLRSGNITEFYRHLNNCKNAKGGYLEFEYFIAVCELEKASQNCKILL